MLLSGFVFGKNLTSLGYPWVEAAVSIIDYVDELVFLECHSDDDTFKTMQAIQKRWPDKVRLEQMDWPPITPSGNSIGTVQTAALRLCKGWYALCCQADEVWWPDSIKAFRQVVEKAQYNSYSFDFDHVGENFQSKLAYHEAAYSRAIRCVRNIPEIVAEWDGWNFKGKVNPSLYVPLPHPICHAGYEYLLPTMRKRINHSFLYPDLPEYQEMADEAKRVLDSGEVPENYAKKTPAFPIPPILLPTVGWKDYTVRKVLLTDPEEALAGM